MASLDIPRPVTARAAAAPLRTTFAWTLAGNVIYAGCQWGMISGLAKLGSTIAVGQFALALAITAPVFMLTNLSLRAVQATDTRGHYSFGDYFALRALGTGIGLLALSTALIVSRRPWAVVGIIVFVALAKSVESFTDIIAGLLQKHERLDQVAISFSLKGICSIVV